MRVICNSQYSSNLPPPHDCSTCIHHRLTSDSDVSRPLVTFVTPVYNRKHLLARALASVKVQTYRNIEHVIVDDGSTDNPDEVIIPYMDIADYPVLYIKKDNGGVHTARNIAISKARGEFILLLDSDDEFMPTAAEEFIRAWQQIPSENRNEYREVVALCMDEHGKQMGNSFPDGINDMTKKQADVARKKANGPHMALMRTDLLQSCPWPEPEGVNFVIESLVWRRLDAAGYRSRFLNWTLYKYHTETEVSNVKLFKLKTIQHSVNDLFRYQYILNNHKSFALSFNQRIKNAILYTLFFHHLKRCGKFPTYGWAQEGLQGPINKVAKIVAYLPAKLLLVTVLKKRFSANP